MLTQDSKSINDLDILIVDDSEINLLLLKKILEKVGMKTRMSLDGTTALQQIEYNLPELIILDVLMPGMNGFELCSALKANQATANIPVIFVSSLESPEDRIRGFHVGAVDFISKPFDPDEILARISTQLSIRKLQITLENKNKQLQNEIHQRQMVDAEIVKQYSILRSIFESTPSPFFLLDKEFNYIGFNKAHAIAMRNLYQANIEVGQSILGYFTSESDKLKAVENFKRTLNGENFLEEDFWGDNDKFIEYFEVIYFPIRNDQQQVVGVGVQARDLTLRRRMEMALEESNEFNSLILNTLPYDMCILNLQGQILYINSRLKAKVGEASLGKLCWDTCTDKNQQCQTCPLLEDFQPGKTYFKVVPNLLGGKTFEVSYTSMMYKGEKAMLQILHDVTEKIKAEEEYRKLNLFNQKVIDNALVGLIVYDLDLRFKTWNPFMEKLSGIPASEVLGKSVVECFPFFKEVGVIENLKKAAAGEATNQLEYQFNIPSTGKRGWVFETTSSIVNGDGKIIGLISFVSDITESKRTTQALFESIKLLQVSQKHEALGHLAGNIAHDFNNLLAVILGYNDLLKNDSDLPPKFVSMLEEVQLASKRGTGLTKQILAYAKHQNIDLANIDFHQLVKNHQGILQSALTTNHSLQLVFNAKASVIQIDEGQFVQVLLNLAVNARDAMEKPGRFIIETNDCFLDEKFFISKGIEAAQEGNYLCVRFQDNGCGIREEIKSRIFDPYFTTKAREKNTGLGLSVVYGIVKQHNGYIFCESTLNFGSTFILYLKTASPDLQNYPDKNPGVPAPAELIKSAINVIIVDDEPQVLNVVTLFVKSEGYRVIKSVASGKEALEILENCEEEIHLVITDFTMPEMTGMELIQKISGQRPKCFFLLMSGYSEQIINIHETNPNIQLLEKPFNKEKFVNKISKLIGAAR